MWAGSSRSTPVADQPWITFAYPQREHEALQDAIEQAVLRTLRSGSYILGAEVETFEKTFCQLTHAPHTVAVSSGTDALVCALLGLGVGASQEVIVPAFGFVAAAEAVLRVGATPVFVDVEPATLGPDPAACDAARSHRTAAVIVMHLFGQAVDLEPVSAALPRTPVLEDAAQAIGTRLGDRQVGTLGTVGAFSFFPAKSLGAAGDAGAVTTADADLANRVRHARVHGAPRAYEWNGPGGNYRMDALQAALLTVKLGALEDRLARRRRMGQALADLLVSHGVTVFRGSPACSPTYAPFVLRTERRDEILRMLRDRHVDARVHYPRTLATANAFRAFCNPGTYPHADQATRQLVSLPCSPELRNDELDRLLQAVDEVFRGL